MFRKQFKTNMKKTVQSENYSGDQQKIAIVQPKPSQKNHFNSIMDRCILHIRQYLPYKVSEWRPRHFKVHANYTFWGKSQSFVKLDWVLVCQAIQIKNAQVYFYPIGLSRCWTLVVIYCMSSQVRPLSTLKCYEYNFSLLRKVRNVYLNIHECIVTKLTFVFTAGWKDILRPILAIQLASTTLSLSKSRQT